MINEGKIVELDLRQMPPFERHDKIFGSFSFQVGRFSFLPLPQGEGQGEGGVPFFTCNSNQVFETYIHLSAALSLPQ